MKCTIFWDITPCNPLSVNRRFGGTYDLHLQGRKMSWASNQRENRWLPPEDGGDVPLKCQLTLNGLHGVISQKMVHYIYFDFSAKTLHWYGRHHYFLVTKLLFNVIWKINYRYAFSWHFRNDAMLISCIWTATMSYHKYAWATSPFMKNLWTSLLLLNNYIISWISYNKEWLRLGSESLQIEFLY
jgi:hypothetical protein